MARFSDRKGINRRCQPVPPKANQLITGEVITMKYINKQNTIKIAICLIGLSMLIGTVKLVHELGEQRDLAWEEESRPKVMPIAWCVNVCRRDMFSSMHSKGESWGTSSSSMNGMAQGDTLVQVMSYCEDTYKDGCLKINKYKAPYIHSDRFGNKANTVVVVK